jgi:hypothetical protein
MHLAWLLVALFFILQEVWKFIDQVLEGYKEHQTENDF